MDEKADSRTRIGMMDQDELKRMMAEDEFGLLKLTPKMSPAMNEEQRLISSFREITAFVKKYGREPEANNKDIKELSLHRRLAGLRKDTKKIQILVPYDEEHLLGKVKRLETLSDICADDSLGLLDDATDIFTLRNVPAMPRELVTREYTARRKPCPDFDKFEGLFKTCHAELASKERRVSRFSQGSQIEVGDFFIMKGLLVYVAQEGARHPTFDGTYNARLRCIFDNGTESDLLLRSLAAALYEDGLRVSKRADHLQHSVAGITEEDLSTGYIYVLKSLSTKPEIRGLQNLFKIGFSTISVEQRIKNAINDPTYLMAPVQIVATFHCYNLNTQKFENLLHRFFGKACLAIDVINSEGKRHIPREWFVAPLPIIVEAIDLLTGGEIIDYAYDMDSQKIVKISDTGKRNGKKSSDT